jgi:iron complex outermembrane receptor protein
LSKIDSRRIRRAHSLTLAAALLAAGAATAQTATETTPAGAPSGTVPDTVVTGAPDLAPNTVPTNAQRERTLREMPGNVSLVPATQFRDRPAVTTLQQALEYTPGVWAATKWGEDSRLSIRGSGLARNFHLRGLTLYLDGIPVNQADGSGDFQELDPLTAYRIEVLRGGNAFTLGSNTLGGAINFVSPTGRLSPGALIRGEAGSFGFARGQAAYGMATPQADAWATVTALTDGGYRVHSQGRSQRFNGNAALRWGPGDMAETRIYAAYADIYQQIPGTVSRQQALTNPKAAATGNVLLNYQRNIRSFRLGTITAIRPQQGVLLEIGGSMVDRDLNHPIFQVIDNESLDFTAFARTTLEGNIAGLPHWTVLGWNFAQGSVRNRRYVNNGGVAGAQTYGTNDQARNFTAYWQSNLTVAPDWQIIGGLQLGQAYRSAFDVFNPAGSANNTSGSGTWQWANPRVGVIWQALPQAQLFANLSWSTEPPTLSDLIPQVPQGGFSNLNAQRAMTIEIGSRGTHGPLEWEVALYRSYLKDEIQLFSLGAGTAFAQNADRTLHTGVEAALLWTMGRDMVAEGDSLALRQAYTYSWFRFDNDPVYGNNQLPGMPRNLYNAELRYRHPSGAWVAPNINWSPTAYFVDNANTTKTDSYVLVGLRGGVQLENGFSVFVEGRNLANTRYISSAQVAPVATANSPIFEPGFGRSVYAGLQYRF